MQWLLNIYSSVHSARYTSHDDEVPVWVSGSVSLTGFVDFAFQTCSQNDPLCFFLYTGVLFYCMYPTQNHAHCLQVALNYHADVNNVSQEGNHVFQMMCERAQECTQTCLTMLDEGANPDATNEVTIQQSSNLFIEKHNVLCQLTSIIMSCNFSYTAS